MIAAVDVKATIWHWLTKQEQSFLWSTLPGLFQVIVWDISRETCFKCERLYWQWFRTILAVFLVIGSCGGHISPEKIDTFSGHKVMTALSDPGGADLQYSALKFLLQHTDPLVQKPINQNRQACKTEFSNRYVQCAGKQLRLTSPSSPFCLPSKYHSIIDNSKPTHPSFIITLGMILYRVSQKKRTFRMLFKPQCTGSITSSRVSLCLGINLLVVSYQD